MGNILMNDLVSIGKVSICTKFFEVGFQLKWDLGSDRVKGRANTPFFVLILASDDFYLLFPRMTPYGSNG